MQRTPAQPDVDLPSPDIGRVCLCGLVHDGLELRG